MAKVVKKLKVVGLDHGNVFYKSYAGPIVKPLILPNQFVRKDLMQADSAFQSKAILHEYETNKFDNETWLWGEDIYKALNPINTYTEQDRYTQKSYKIMTEFGLSEMLEDGDNAIVVTGMPSSQIGSPYEADLKSVITGAHVVTKNKDDKVYKIQDTITLSQPMGTLMYIYLDDEGKVVDEDITNEYIGILDGGGGTFDIDGIRELQPEQKDRLTIHQGLYGVYEKIADYINREHPEARATAKLVEFQVLGDNPESYKISKRLSMDISKVKDQLFSAYAEDIFPQINQRWTSRSKFDRLYMTGGSSTPLFKYFKQWEKDLILISDVKQHTPLPADIKVPQMANVIGFYRYGVLTANAMAQA